MTVGTGRWLFMAISLMIQQIGRGRSSNVPTRPHVMLAGISQTVFLKNWGDPDVEIYLRKLGSLREKGTLYLTVNSGEKADHSIWIYRKKDRILFLQKGSCIATLNGAGSSECGTG
jgi:hypothetical protein